MVNELSKLLNITHKYVVKVHSYFAEWNPETRNIDSYCIVMDYVEGLNLREFMYQFGTSILMADMQDLSTNLIEETRENKYQECACAGQY